MKGVNRVKTKAKDFWHDFLVVLRRSDMVILPGNIAFFLILAIIPFIGLITYGASMLNLSTTYLYDFIAHSFSTDIADLVLGVNLSNSANFFITLVFGLYIASNGADSIITASNTIYGVEHNSWMRRRWKAFWMTLLIVILLIFMLIVPVFGNNIVSLVKEVNLNGNITSRIISIYDLLNEDAINTREKLREKYLIDNENIKLNSNLKKINDNSIEPKIIIPQTKPINQSLNASSQPIIQSTTQALNEGDALVQANMLNSSQNGNNGNQEQLYTSGKKK